MKDLSACIKDCTICKDVLENQPRPVFSFNKKSKIVIIGQAPGSVVHRTGIPWDDKSGEALRKWMDVDNETFYDTEKIAIVPMGFCYPGKGKTGDLAPRKECAPKWHDLIFESFEDLRLIVLIGTYAQNYYLKKERKRTLTETVRTYSDYLPKYFVLPHPSPRNNIWMKKNEWFKEDIVPIFRHKVKEILS